MSEVKTLPAAAKHLIAVFEDPKRTAERGAALAELKKSLEATTDRLTGGLAHRKRAGLHQRVDREKVRELRDAGKTLAAIAEEVNCSRNHVSRMLRELGAKQPAGE